MFCEVGLQMATRMLLHYFAAAVGASSAVPRHAVLYGTWLVWRRDLGGSWFGGCGWVCVLCSDGSRTAGGVSRYET